MTTGEPGFVFTFDILSASSRCTGRTDKPWSKFPGGFYRQRRRFTGKTIIAVPPVLFLRQMFDKL